VRAKSKFIFNQLMISHDLVSRGKWFYLY